MAEQRACPEDSVYRQFLRGDCSEATAELLTDHLHACLRCAERVEALMSEDGLFQAVRGMKGADTPLGEPDPRVQDMRRRLQHLNPTVVLEQTAAVVPLNRLGSYRVMRLLGQGGMGRV